MFVKASVLHDNLTALDTLGAQAVEVRRRGADIIRRIEAMSRVDWAPIEVDLEWLECLSAVGGLAAPRALNAAALHTVVQGPLLRPILSATVALVGYRPEAALRFTKEGWRLVYRDMGRAAFEGQGRSGYVAVEGLPASCAASPAFLEAVAGGLDGIVGVFGGACRFEARQVGSRIEWHGRWG